MHDLLEGVVPMEIKWVLKYYIIDKHAFSIDFLNTEIHRFKFGTTEKKNRPCANFTRQMLTSNSNSIKQKAVPCWLLLRSLPLMIHHKILYYILL